MKKNILLYILLFFLIIVNGFFLYNYMGKPIINNQNKERKNPMSFIITQLDFNDEQLEKLKTINKDHHQNMMRITNDSKELKDALFNKLSDASINKKEIDSITTLIGQKEKELDTEAFYHFRSIQKLCNNQQKETFKKIIKDALHKGGERNQRPQRLEGEERNQRPPRLEGGERSGPSPPPHGEKKQGPPPPIH